MFVRFITASVIAAATVTALGTGTAVAAKTTCSSVAACALYSNAQSGPGLEGISHTGTGLLGESSVSGPNSINIGVHGLAPSDTGVGVFGQGYAGMYGRGNANGVYGESTYTGTVRSFGYGVLGAGQGGVYGIANGEKQGVVGLNFSGSGPNAFGMLAIGLYAPGLFSAGPTGVIAQSYGSYSSTGTYVPGSGVALQLETTVHDYTSTLIRGLDANGKSVMSLDSAGNLTVAGSLVAHGTPLVATTAADGTASYAYGSRTTVPSIEHIGEARLTGGAVFVPLGHVLTSTIDSSAAYMVFVTPEANSHGLFVSERRPSGFMVRENDGGTSSIAFEYRIVARPIDASQSQGRVTHMLATGEGTSFAIHKPELPSGTAARDLRERLPR